MLRPIFCSYENIDDIALSESMFLSQEDFKYLFVNITKFGNTTEILDENPRMISSQEDFVDQSTPVVSEFDFEKLLIKRNGYNDVNNWKTVIEQSRGNISILYCRVFKIIRLVSNHFVKKRIFKNIKDFKKNIVKSSINLFKENFSRLTKDYSDDFSLFDMFVISPLICFWISFKYNTNDYMISKHALQNFSGICSEYLVIKEVEFLTNIKYNIRKFMVI
jgi:hypothetical protein